MNHTDEPIPREAPLSVLRWRPPTGDHEVLPIGEAPQVSFAAVADARRSDRQCLSLSRMALGTLLWNAARVRHAHLGVEQRCAPSAGGLHPIDLVVVEPLSHAALLYDPYAHVLRPIMGIDAARLAEGCAVLREVLPEARGTFIVALAKFDITGSRYRHADSLVWRDAGCLLMMLHMTAAWLGLRSCLLGTTASSVAEVLSSDFEVRGVGALAVGS